MPPGRIVSDCLFCAIASGAIPSAAVHEDERTLAFLDIQPLQRGHALVIPKAHAAKLEDADPADAAAVMQTAQRLVAPLCRAVGAMDATIAINNGPDAGQEVGHLHLHIVPRHAGDAEGPIHALFADRPTPDAGDLQELAATVRQEVEDDQ